MRLIPRESGHAFEIAFNLRGPWQLDSLALSQSRNLLEVLFNYRCMGSETCPFCGKTLVDMCFSTKRTWRHFKFFQYETRMTACLPVFRCSNQKCVASADREAILNTLYLDVLLMVSDSGARPALETLLAPPPRYTENAAA